MRSRIAALLSAATMAASLAVVVPTVPAAATVRCSDCATAQAGADAHAEGFVVSEAQFNQMFPNRNAFYTYSGLTAALSAYPEFANTGSDTVKRQEAAAFLANVSHETGGLVYVVEQNTANSPTTAMPPSRTGARQARPPTTAAVRFS